ncbi:YjeO family protein [Escherichia coli]|nr:DUF2645 family protein [Escherichia coli]EFC1511159.1 DUF2645 family protein [Escherichia coli]EFH3056561.1 DUF2645 family protein [Escherichia coli]EFH4381005.1 DUF2645 family protein [Escherichia coli]EFO0356177.1 DUF2645 family protein [Escherichia coli]
MMNWKSFSLNLIWFVISIFWIDFLSVQDKEWFIDGRGINNICDVMTYLENDDIRPVGIIMTLPLFIPYIYAVIWKKQHSLWQYFVISIMLFYWLWQFFLRYLFCW